MQNAKTERNQIVMRMVEEEGRTFTWIGKQLGISDTMARKVYHSTKERQRIAKQQEAQA